MKKIIKFFSRHFAKQKTFSSLFSEAVSEGIQETYKEMGYRFDINEDQETSVKEQDIKVFEK